MEKRNQHYIPQFYLKYFTDPLTPLLNMPYVWVYDFKKNIIKNKAPKSIAYQKGINDILDDNGNITSIVEEQFQEIENDVSRVFRKLIKIKYICRSERIVLCKFVQSMRVRTPYFQKIYKEVVKAGGCKSLENHGINVESLPEKVTMDSAIRTTNITSHLLLNLSWSLLITNSKTPFITSDNPVTVIDPNDINSKYAGFLSSIDVQVFLPICPKICLFGTWGRKRRIVEKITDEETEKINFRTYLNSYEYLFSSREKIDKKIILANTLNNINF